MSAIDTSSMHMLLASVAAAWLFLLTNFCVGLRRYTPEHMHCEATTYAPVVPPNTPFLACRSTSGATKAFRIAATGTVLEVDHVFKASLSSCTKQL